MSQIACRFFGGDWDGRTEMRDDAPYELRGVAVHDSVRYFPPPRHPQPPDLIYREFAYRRRGPVRAGTADYELVGR